MILTQAIGRNLALTSPRMSAITTPTTNLLLVDNDPTAAAVTERGLQSAPAPIQLRVAADGLEAYRYISGAGSYTNRRAYPLPDVIFSEINLPRFSGLEFLRWLRQQAPEHTRSIPVIIVSSAAVPEELEQARAFGARMFLLKPVNWPEFWQELRAARLLKNQ
jgi:two-component system, chemotaxis family, response regulator Rcp1